VIFFYWLPTHTCITAHTQQYKQQSKFTAKQTSLNEISFVQALKSSKSTQSLPKQVLNKVLNLVLRD